ncbi:MAG: RDD family protein [Planctomycetota bacterium]|jgi:uncharacterized RDD family membrane protein YckC|nr:RDD family protein [Planctomycetota bacterium]
MSSEIPIIPPADNEFEFLPRPGFWRRFFCWLLDMTVLVVVCGVVNYFILGIDPPDPGNAPDALPPDPSNIEFVANAALAFLYFALMHGRFGKTLGKMLGRFRVVAMNGSPIGYRAAFVRAFWSTGIFALIEMPRLLFPDSGLGWLSDVGALYLIANCLALVWDQRHNRALHDLLAGTRVAVSTHARNSGI